MAEETALSKSAQDSALQRCLLKLETAIKSENFYEAHQLYRTLHFRYLRQNKYEDTLKLLYDGALVMFYNGQHTSGVDLSNLYVEVLVKSNAEPCEFIIKKVVRLLEMMQKNTTEKDAFVNATVVWSSKGIHKKGHPTLHQLFAQVFWKEKNYIQAKTHFLHSQDGSGLALMLIELHKARGYSTEVDLFIAQVVLQCLCLRNINTAIKAFECYTTQHPSIDEGPPYLLPLLNFIWFLLQAVQRGRQAMFTVLCEQYEVSIERDPTYRHYLEKIGEIFFDVPLHNSRRPNFLGNMFRLLSSSGGGGGGARETDDDDEEDTSSASNSQRTGASNSSLSGAATHSTMDIEPLD